MVTGAEADGVGVEPKGVVVGVTDVGVEGVTTVEVPAIVVADVPAIVVTATVVDDTTVVATVVATVADGVVDDTIVVAIVVDEATAEVDGEEMLPHDRAQNAPSLEIAVVLRFRQGKDVVVKLASSVVQLPVHPAPLQYEILPVPPRQLTSADA